jgi:hypothetical protein
MRIYDVKTTGNFDDRTLEPLKEIYSKQKQRHPIHDPDFLRARADFMKRYMNTAKPRNFLFLKDGKLVGYLPYIEGRAPIVKSRIIFPPIQLIDEDYSNLFYLLLQKTLRSQATSTFFFNFTDVHRGLETRALENYGCSREDTEFVTIVNYDGNVGKDIRYYVRKSIDFGCYVDSRLNHESFIEYYKNCMYESRRRKGIEVGWGERNPVGLFEYFKKLVELDKGRMSFVRDENDSIVGGIFIVYNDQICIYFHAATSVEGLSKFAGYLNLNGAIEFCQQRGLIFDLFGSHKNGDKNMQNLYMFKRKWGQEFDIARYMYHPILARIAMKMLETLRGMRSTIMKTQ